MLATGYLPFNLMSCIPDATGRATQQYDVGKSQQILKAMIRKFRAHTSVPLIVCSEQASKIRILTSASVVMRPKQIPPTSANASSAPATNQTVVSLAWNVRIAAWLPGLEILYSGSAQAQSLPSPHSMGVLGCGLLPASCGAH